MHPYRESTAPLVKVEPQKPGWLRRLWTGDNGLQYAVCATPSDFRTAEGTLNGPFTYREMKRFIKRYLAAHRFGFCTWYSAPKGSVWPPKTNRDYEDTYAWTR